MEKAGLAPISESTLTRLRRRRQVSRILFYVGIVVMCLFCAGPFIWIFVRSLRDPFIAQTDFELLPKHPSLESYFVVFENSEFYGVTFDQALINGFILSGLTAIVVLFAGSFVAYVLAKFTFPMKGVVTVIIFAMTSLPPLIIVIPYFIQVKTLSDILPILDLHDNLLGLVLPYSAFNLPLSVFVLRAFFEEIPDDLWKAAKVDGASNFQIFTKVILPLTVPGIFTTLMLVFIASWNELLFAQIWLTSDVNHTVPRAILRFVQSPLSLQANWDTDLALMAATSIATIPLVILVLIFQKQLIKGITSGAVKG
ncbi:MAG: carbohydrate ABC transporter permease [Candidatus Thorarchaeota archaeon]